MLYSISESGQNNPTVTVKNKRFENKKRRNKMLQKLYRFADFVSSGASIFFGLIALASAVVATILENTFNYHWPLSHLMSIALLFVLAGFMFWLARLDYKFNSIRRAYTKTFGFEFPVNRTERGIQQPAINLQLKRLAAIFNSACAYKDHLIGTLPDRNSTEKIEWVQTRLTEVKMAENTIIRDKKIFWEAHAIARKAGMWTLKKSGEYLLLK
jgi:hypothetical protein